MNKYCEFCGQKGNSYFYRFVAIPDYFVFLDSPQVSYNDKNKRIVYLNDGSQVPYMTILSNNCAYYIPSLTTHIFCSEKCEISFVNLTQGVLSNQAMYISPLFNYKEAHMLKQLTFSPEGFRGCPAQCLNCNEQFPKTDNKHLIIDITSFEKIAGSLDAYPRKESDYAFSDINEKHQIGHFHLYNIDMESFQRRTEASFCSNDCSYSYSLQQNKLILSKSNMLQGGVVAIYPSLLEVNEGLENTYPYRPTKM